MLQRDYDNKIRCLYIYIIHYLICDMNLSNTHGSYQFNILLKDINYGNQELRMSNNSIPLTPI